MGGILRECIHSLVVLELMYFEQTRLITCVQALGRLRAIYLQLDVRCQLHHHTTRHGARVRTSQGELCSLERALRHWDGSRFIGEVKQMFPEMERIFIQASAFKLRELELLDVDLLEDQSDMK